MLRDLITLDLQDQGATVVTATDGEEAMELLKRINPDLVLLDLLMPKKDGYAVLQFLKEQGMGFPAVVISNLSAPEEITKCKELGAKDFIVKSELGSGDLWESVRKFMGL
jgi:CheY-like chemotaxis protein